MALKKEVQDIYSSLPDVRIEGERTTFHYIRKAPAPDAEFLRGDETLEQQVTMVECARLLA